MMMKASYTQVPVGRLRLLELSGVTHALLVDLRDKFCHASRRVNECGATLSATRACEDARRMPGRVDARKGAWGQHGRKGWIASGGIATHRALVDEEPLRGRSKRLLASS